MTAHTLKKKLIEIYEEWGWDLYDKFDHAYDALKLCLTDPEEVYKRVNIPEDHREKLMINIKKKLAAAPIKIRATFDL
jgi:translation initiation factor 2 subunit 1